MPFSKAIWIVSQGPGLSKCTLVTNLAKYEFPISQLQSIEKIASEHNKETRHVDPRADNN